MNFIASNHRYKLYSSGFKHIVEFRWHNQKDKDMFRALVTELTDVYGTAGLDFEKLNENWRQEQNSRIKRRRIYYKDPEAMTMILLKIS